MFYVFYLPHYGIGAYNVFQYIGKMFIADITTPFRVIKYSFKKKENGKFSVVAILRLLTMIVFIIENVIAVIKTI